MGSKLLVVLGTLMIMALHSFANAACPPGGCGSNSADWEDSAQAFLSSDVPLVGISPQDIAEGSSLKIGQAVTNNALKDTEYVPKLSSGSSMDSIQTYRSDSFPRGKILKAMQSVSSTDLIIDVSNNHTKGDAFIRGAIYVPSKSFIYDNGTIRPIPEVEKILGDAGVSNDDSVVLYSSYFGSGEASFVFWLMKYIGQDNIKLLDGDLNNWTASSLPLDTRAKILKKANYVSRINPDLLADYAYVKSGVAQLVDARSFLDFGSSRIPNSYWIATIDVLVNGRIKDAIKLNETFLKLNKSKPIVVYSTDIDNASLVWYTLQLMGFDSRIYTWKDWVANEQPPVAN